MNIALTIGIDEQVKRDILRLYETSEDGQGYDVPKDRMKVMARMGLIRYVGFTRYEITGVGYAVIESLMNEPSVVVPRTMINDLILKFNTPVHLVVKKYNLESL